MPAGESGFGGASGVGFDKLSPFGGSTPSSSTIGLGWDAAGATLASAVVDAPEAGDEGGGSVRHPLRHASDRLAERVVRREVARRQGRLLEERDLVVDGTRAQEPTENVSSSSAGSSRNTSSSRPGCRRASARPANRARGVHGLELRGRAGAPRLLRSRTTRPRSGAGRTRSADRTGPWDPRLHPSVLPGRTRRRTGAARPRLRTAA